MTASRIRVAVPAETNGEDRLVGSLTFRHAAYLAVAAAGVAVMLLGHASIPRLALGAVLAVTGVVGAMLRPYGEPLDRLAVAATAYLLRRRTNRVAGECTEAPGPVDDHSTVETEAPSVVEPAPVEATHPRARVSPAGVRRVVVAVTVCGVAALAVTRLIDRPTVPPPEPRVVVVPVPAPDPWQEVDRELEEWLDSLG
ncbi:MAG: hypothetical protein QOD07_993 [Frankiaceae bacterium]|nr:hypothetical protein [Frankiaceae bacterium]